MLKPTATPDRAALMHRLTYHAAGLSDRALQLLVLMAELSARFCSSNLTHTMEHGNRQS